MAPPSGVLGTVAGDDTIFIATEAESTSARLVGALSELAGLAPRRSA
jgi:arginine repressor